MTEVASRLEKATGEDEIRPRVFECIKRQRNTLDNMGVSGGVNIWRNTKRLADW